MISDTDQIEMLRKQIHEFFRGLPRDSGAMHAWAGTMIQGLKPDQIETGQSIWPAIIAA